MWQFYVLWGIAAGMGSGDASMVLGSALVNRWFSRQRVLALGILGTAFSSGQLVFTPLVMQIDIEFGWRAAVQGLAGLLG